MQEKKFLLGVLGAAAMVMGGMMMISFTTPDNEDDQNMQILRVQSDDIVNGQILPADQTCDGKGVSPHLSWGNTLTGVKSFSVICDDPDAPSQVWVHWVIFNIPESTNSLPADIPAQETLANGSVQGLNDSGTLGFDPACPPEGHGTHHYFFKVYALDTMLDLPAGSTKADVMAAMQGHILAVGQLVATYSRD